MISFTDSSLDEDETPTPKQKKKSPVEVMTGYLEGTRKEDNVHRDRAFDLEKAKFEASQQERMKMLEVMNKMVERMA